MNKREDIYVNQSSHGAKKTEMFSISIIIFKENLWLVYSFDGKKCFFRSAVQNVGKKVLCNVSI